MRHRRFLRAVRSMGHYGRDKAQGQSVVASRTQTVVDPPWQNRMSLKRGDIDLAKVRGATPAKTGPVGCST